jgi:peptidoglycan/LPS O-acetylase OafA/YrhL
MNAANRVETAFVPYERGVDALRGLAILAVVVYHAFPDRLTGGFVGVDVFFVISGYLITRVLCAEKTLTGGVAIGDFYRRRARRLLPPLIPLLVACLVTGWWWLPAWNYAELGKQVALGGLFVANVGYWLEAGYFDAGSQAKWLLHLWSLGVEEQFYLLFPWLFAICVSSQTVFKWVWGLVVVSAGLSLWWSADHASAAFFLLPTRAWELGAGALLALYGSRFGTQVKPCERRHGYRVAAAWSGAAAIVVCSFTFDKQMVFPGFAAMGPVMGALLFVWGAQGLATGGWAWRVMAGLGLVSYGFYLWHWPVLSLVRMSSSGVPTDGVLVLGLCLALLAAIGSYHLVERPVRDGVRFPRLHGAAPLLLGVSMLATVAAGGYVYLYSGLPNRAEPELQRLGAFRFEHGPAYRSGECFIEKIEEIDVARRFPASCVDQAADAKGERPLAVLWGDSMAAHLYPGLQALSAQKGVRLAQFTVASCPPLIGYRALPLCAELNAINAARIVELKPKWVLMAALDWGRNDLPELQQTIAALTASAEVKVVLVGLPPKWNRHLPLIAYQLAQRSAGGMLPSWLADQVSEETWTKEMEWVGLAKEMSVPYVSLLDTLCDERTCRIRLDDAVDHLTAWDGIHLTEWGSKWVAPAVYAHLIQHQ